MWFLRENLFPVVLVGVVVVIGALLILMNAGPSGQVEDMAAEREKLSSAIANLYVGEPVNEGKVKAQKARVKRSRELAGLIRQDSVAWNKRDYEVLTYRTPDKKTIKAFPHNKELYDQYNLMYHFTDAYRSKYDEMLAGLRPTRPPTAAEIQAEQKFWEENLRKKLEREKLKAGEGPAGPGVLPGGPMPYAPGVGVMRPGGATKTTPTEPTVDPKEQGLNAVMLRRAQAGLVYVDPETLDRVFRDGDSLATPTQLWQGQVNLWVTQDILAAIQATNDEVLKAVAPEQRDVTRSAIKRLVSIGVTEQYVTGPSAPAAGRPAGPAYGPGGGPGMPTMYRPGDPGRTASPVLSKTTGAGTLTGRACCPRYDVIHYDFTVVMPTRYLQKLMENLLTQNLHAILRVSLGEVDEGREKEYYYYGIDPVLRVEIRGELLLLTDWHRGTWDPKTQEWTSPPLMPWEVLQKLGPSALRPEDEQRNGRPE